MKNEIRARTDANASTGGGSATVMVTEVSGTAVAEIEFITSIWFLLQYAANRHGPTTTAKQNIE